MTLRSNLIVLLVFCWFLPMLFTVVLSGMMTVSNARSYLSDIMSASVDNTMEIIHRDLDRVVNDALSVSYDSTVRNAYSQFIQTGNKAILNNSATAYLQQKFYRSDLVQAAYLVFPGEVTASTYDRRRLSYKQMAEFFDSEVYRNAAEILATLDTGVLFVQDEGRFYMVRLLSLRDNAFNPYVMLVLDVDTATLFEGFAGLSWIDGARVLVNDVAFELVGQADGQGFPAPVAGMQTQLDGSVLYMSGSRQANRYSMEYYALADLQPMMGEMGGSIVAVLVVALFSAVLMAFVLYFILFRVNRPIAALSKLASRIEQGELGAQCDTERLGNAEFVYLGTQMNAMSARLQDQFERLYREELALRDAKIKALQSQINPHFLGNTLEIINWEARLAGNVKVSQMLEALSTILRASQDRSANPVVHLSEELMYVNSYLFIIRERLGKRLKIRQEIDDGLLDWMVPRLILQPIVENAVEHGVNVHQHGTITIRAKRLDGEWMVLEVENDNAMSREDEEAVARLLGEEAQQGENAYNIGIRNVHQRLRILYGAKSGLSVKTTKNGTTVSSMCIQNRETRQFEST